MVEQHLLELFCGGVDQEGRLLDCIVCGYEDGGVLGGIGECGGKPCFIDEVGKTGGIEVG